jgi:hypothetical protein
MAHEFDDLIADLDAAKADLARSVKRCRNFLGERRLPHVTIEQPEAEKSAFNWASREDR